jgi:hypothetical protein
MDGWIHDGDLGNAFEHMRLFWNGEHPGSIDHDLHITDLSYARSGATRIDDGYFGPRYKLFGYSSFGVSYIKVYRKQFYYVNYVNDRWWKQKTKSHYKG